MGSDSAELDDTKLVESLYYNEEGFILYLAIASGLRGYVPHLAKPALIFGIIEKACSNGPYKTIENSLFVTEKFIFVKDKFLTAFAHRSFNDLNTETSNGWWVWVVCGGKQKRRTSFCRHESMTSCVPCAHPQVK